MTQTPAAVSAANQGVSRESGQVRALDSEVASNYCPRCSARLEGRSCKLICPGCGYYMSCSDFY